MVWMLAASASFAAMAACMKLASQHSVPVGQILFYRGLISVILIYAYLRGRQISWRTPHWAAHAKRGIIGFIGMAAYVSAISLLPLATAVTLNYASPLILGCMLLFIYRERPHVITVASLLGGIGGIALLLRPTFSSSQWFGASVALASALTAAISALNIRALGQLAEPPARTVFYFSLSVTLGALPWFCFSNPDSLTSTGAAYLLGAGILATVGQYTLTHAYQRGQTLIMSLLGYSQVVFSSLIGIVLWRDKLPLASWLGMALIIVCGAAASGLVRPRPSAARTLQQN